MKIALFIGFTLIIIPHWASSTNESVTDLVKTPRKEILLNTVIKQLKTFWVDNRDDSNTVVGRCFGLAKKIKTILPIAIFLMGVILTLLGFLTLFSMKTLGLVGALLLLNTSGAVAKIATAFAAHKEEKHPQTVHFHIHKDDDHHGYHIGHTSPDIDWDRMSKNNQEFDMDRLQSYNLYNKLINNLSVKY